MARKEAVPARELEICRRLREFREGTKIPRSAFALSVGISANRLAEHENGRVPLRYGVFKAINAKYFLSAQWLVTGEGNVVSSRPFDEGVLKNKPGDREMLSVLFDDELGDAYADSALDAMDALYRPDGFLATTAEYLGKFMDGVDGKSIPWEAVASVQIQLQKWADLLGQRLKSNQVTKDATTEKKRLPRRRST